MYINEKIRNTRVFLWIKGPDPGDPKRSESATLLNTETNQKVYTPTPAKYILIKNASVKLVNLKKITILKYIFFVL